MENWWFFLEMEILSFYRNGKLDEFLEIETLCFPRDGKLGDYFF